jgi:hypothetical protein
LDSKVITWKYAKARTPSGHTGRSRDGSRKTSSSIRSGPTTLTKNHLKSREKSRNNVEKLYVNCNVNETATSF